MEKNEIQFEYTYSAPEQSEVRQIREKYLPREESKMDKLRQLDRSVTKRGLAASLSLGIFSMLALGMGMCCCMIWSRALFIPGLIIGILGILGAALALPVYRRITERERRRIAPEILRLAGEVTGEQA